VVRQFITVPPVQGDCAVHDRNCATLRVIVNNRRSRHRSYLGVHSRAVLMRRATAAALLTVLFAGTASPLGVCQILCAERARAGFLHHHQHAQRRNPPAAHRHMHHTYTDAAKSRTGYQLANSSPSCPVSCHLLVMRATNVPENTARSSTTRVSVSYQVISAAVRKKAETVVFLSKPSSLVEAVLPILRI
jgi:hypothetical protein